MKKNLVNASLLIAVLAILGVFATYVRVGATADSVVVLKTSGMTCSSCVAQVTKTLQSQKGVAATEVDLQGGWVIAGYDSKQVAPEALAQKVAKGGFQSRVQTVLTPEQFKKITGHQVGQQAAGGTGCCGSKGCCGNK